MKSVDVEAKVREARGLLFEAQEPNSLTTRELEKKLAAAMVVLDSAHSEVDAQVRRERRQAYLENKKEREQGGGGSCPTKEKPDFRHPNNGPFNW